MTTSAPIATAPRPEMAADGETAGEALQARLGRQRVVSPAGPRSLWRSIPAWLQSGWSRLPGPRPHPMARGRPVMLRDGSAVLIRQVQRTDAPLLADGFTRLSAESRRMRFLRRKDELTAAELRYITDIDHHDHEALGALSHADGRGVGIARYVRDADDPQAAEIAVTIVDDWQGRGLGSELLGQLSGRARQEGIRRFTALVSADNAAMIRLLRNAGATRASRGPGTVGYEIALMPMESHSWRARFEAWAEVAGTSGDLDRSPVVGLSVPPSAA